MADETDQEHGAATSGGVDPAATAMALSSASQTKADTFLNEQTVLVRLQAAELRREDKLRHWSLRVHHISDVMKLAFQLSLALIGLAVVIAIGVAIWSAAHDDGLVIEAFDVPPDLEIRGLTGKVIASQVLDRLSALQAATDSSRAANSYASNWGSDIKVQIPETGISIGELNRYLREWLGNETDISGEIYHTATGIAITARPGSDTGRTFLGTEADLDSLTQKAAESIYARTQPYRYGRYLDETGRSDEASAVYKQLALHGSVREQAWAFSGWGGSEFIRGHIEVGRDMEAHAIALDPNNALSRAILGFLENALGHPEAALAAYSAEITILARGDGGLSGAGAQVRRLDAEARIAELTGDYGSEIALSAQFKQPDSYAPENWLIISLALSSNHDTSRAVLVPRSSEWDSSGYGRQEDALFAPAELALVRMMGAIAREDWRATVNFARMVESYGAKVPVYETIVIPRSSRPEHAFALANLGRASEAHAMVDRTPADCSLCLRMRGNIDAVENNWGGAAYWFGIAVKQAPSIPFAYTDWGAMLLHQGDYDAAIAKFTLANQKGPHFADPLEMWGEALMLKNRSDLALAKFEGANKYAPNWGRLHIKWGEALSHVGHKDEARAQYRIASTLDLSVADRAKLARDIRF